MFVVQACRYANGKLLGGCDATKALIASGEAGPEQGIGAAVSLQPCLPAMRYLSATPRSPACPPPCPCVTLSAFP